MGIEFAKQRYGSTAGGSCFRQGWIAGDHHVRLPATAPGAAMRVEEGWYDGAIMMVRTQITLERELQKQARQRAGAIGVSLAEYVRRLVAQDLAHPKTKADVTCVFDLGSSGGSNIATEKAAMIAEAFHAARRKARH